MNVTMVNGSRKFDGHTNHFRVFVDGLATQGVTARVYTCVDPSAPSAFATDGERIAGRRFPGGGMAEMAYNRYFPILARQVARLPGDLIHVNDAYLARAADYHPRVVATLMDLAKRTTRFYPRSYSWVHNRCLRSARRCLGLICSSEFVRRDIVQVLGLSPDRVRTVPQFSRLAGVPASRVPPPEPTKERPWTLLYVAFDRPHKNISAFLEVLAGLDDRFRGHLISQPSRRTRDRVAQLGLGARLTIESGLPDLTSTYRAADILVFPSLYEGYGAPLLEAMAQGLPILASDRTSIPEVVGPGGQLLDPTLPDLWVQSVQSLIRPETYRMWSERSWSRGREFTPARTGSALLSAYTSFLAQGSAS